MRRWGVVLALLLAGTAAWWLGGRGDGDAPGHGEGPRAPAAGDPADSRREPPARPPQAPVLRGASESGEALAALDAGEGGVYGYVYDHRSGEAVPGVRVLALSWYEGREADLLRRATSQDTGRYALRGFDRLPRSIRVVALGGGWISAEAEPDVPRGGMLSRRAPVFLGRWVRHDVPVLRAAAVAGTVTLPDGRPAAGAEVRPAPFHGTAQPSHRGFPWEGLPVTTCDETGRFVYGSVPAARGVGMQADLSGYATAYSEVLSLETGTTTSVAFAFDVPRDVHLKVVSASGEAPVAGAETWIRWTRAATGTQGEVQALTDTEGRAVFESLPVDPVRIAVRAEGFLRVELDGGDGWGGVLEPGGEGRFAGRVALVPLAYVSGRVEWPEGPRGDGVSVRVRAVEAPGHADYEAEARVEEGGRFRVPTPPTGVYEVSLEAWDDGLCHLARAEVGPGDRGIVLRPEPVAGERRRRRGTCGRWTLKIHGPDGRPVRTAFLGSDVQGDVDLQPRLSATPYRPGEGGLVEIDVYAKGRAWLYVCAVETASGRPAGAKLFGPFGAKGGTRELHLEEPRVLRGRVVDDEGRGVQAVELWATAVLRGEGVSTFVTPSAVHGTAITDANGAFAFERAGSCDYILRVEHAAGWGKPPNLRVRAGEADVVVRLAPTFDCDVKVLGPEGAPVRADVTLTQTDGARGKDAFYDSLRSRTDAHGVAHVRGVERTATYDLHVESPDPRLTELFVEDWTPRDETVRLPCRPVVAGRVETLEGRPVGDVDVHAFDELGVHHRVRADAAGRFLLRGVESWPVQLWAEFPEDRYGPEDAPPREVTVVEADARDVVVRLRNRRELLVRAESIQEGAWIPAVWLTRLSEGEMSGAVKMAGAGEDGVARFRDLDPGASYRLWAGPTDTGRYWWSDVGPDDHDVRLPVRKGSEVSGRVDLPAGVEDAWVGIGARGVHVSTKVGPNGTWRLVGVPPGEWTIVATCDVDSGERTQSQTASAGAALHFDLTKP